MNNAPCPDCGKTINATQASLNRECPECGTYFTKLVRMTQDDENDPAEFEAGYGDAV